MKALLRNIQIYRKILERPKLVGSFSFLLGTEPENLPQPSLWLVVTM